MKLLIISLVILAVVAHVHAFLPLLTLKKDIDSSENESMEKYVIKVPKFDSLGKKLWSLKEKLENKDTLFEKKAEKKNNKVEASIRHFFDDAEKAKAIFDKLQSFNTPKPVEEKPCKCEERTYDDCDRDHIRYFS